jgi:hypothetical protein
MPDISDLKHPRDGGDLNAWADIVSARHGSLTPDEVKAIYRYTTNDGYTQMNAYLRGTTSYAPAGVKADVQNAISGLNKLPVHSGTTLRGTDIPQSVLNNTHVGGLYPDAAFQSSSTLAHVAEGFRVRNNGNAILHIDGRFGVDVSALSHYGKEAEILFTPSNLLVTQRTWNPAGYWDIFLKEQ